MTSMGKKKLTGSFAAKVAAFFLLVISVFGAVAGGFFTLCFVREGVYQDYDHSGAAGLFLEEGYGTYMADVYAVRDYLAAGEIRNAEAVCEGKNIDIALLDGEQAGAFGIETDNPAVIWSTYDGSYETNGLTRDIYMKFSAESLTGNRIVNYHKLYAQKDYVFRVYFNPDFPEKDWYWEIYNGCLTLYNIRYLVLWVTCDGIFLGLNSFLFLMCSAGRRNGVEGIQPSVFTSIPLDLYTIGFGIVIFFLLCVSLDWMGFSVSIDSVVEVILLATAVAMLALMCTFYLRELAVRMKLGKWWRNTVVYRLLRLAGRILRFLWRCQCSIFRGVPTVLNIMIVFLGICILEFFGVCIFMRQSGALLLWMLEKVVLFFAVAYISLICKKLLNGSRALVQGRQEERIDTRYMFGDFRECGENLNNIGQGISRAVAERMKSERLKTELITNVSHDIKTPLTSIINYANLIAEEPSENERITEYSEVLVRQSGRLKKLLEDLLEASKATTGNLDLNLQPCEVSVILSQAIGEYQQRMEEKQLELIVNQPEQQVYIMADGRHLWRVFDNLLNNICKYAREDSRVYLTVEVEEKTGPKPFFGVGQKPSGEFEGGQGVNIIFRNMSKYALNITPEELQERFTRGDKSRHMEGNGLGLSIAKSLTELMGGWMEIVTDGDLFKVILHLELSESE